jgi:hypothetical protein
MFMLLLEQAPLAIGLGVAYGVLSAISAATGIIACLVSAAL